MQLHAHTQMRTAGQQLHAWSETYTHICAKAHTPANAHMRIQFSNSRCVIYILVFQSPSLSQFGSENIALGAQSYQKTECRKY